jgi:hypothetical protein
MEYRGQIWVVSGDYKIAPDPTCTGFEPVPCHTFITESTFGLPIFRWPGPGETLAEINAWWRGNQLAGKASVLFVYPLGKARACSPSIARSYNLCTARSNFNGIYHDGGVALPATQYARSAPPKTDWTRALILAPPVAKTAPWLRRFGDFSTGMASGWMRIRGTRRRRSIDRGFVLSDHADWPALLSAIRASGAERVWVTHGYRAPLARCLAERRDVMRSRRFAGGRKQRPRTRRRQRASPTFTPHSTKPSRPTQNLAMCATSAQRPGDRRYGHRALAQMAHSRATWWRGPLKKPAFGWLFGESYHAVGDLAETIALLLPSASYCDQLLRYWVEGCCRCRLGRAARRESMIEAWRAMASPALGLERS